MKIAIAGYGVEGRANYAYWRNKHPDAEFTIVDNKEPADVPNTVEVLWGDNAFESLQGFDLVIRTAGLSPHKIKTDGKIWTASNEFFEACPAPIIGITGSKGKGTVASFVDSILKASGRTSWLVGNIGLPALNVLDQITPDDVVVYELSSFQLWDLERSPTIGVVTIIEPDHLDVHVDFDDYIAAKTHISLYQKASEVTYFRAGDTYAQQIADAGKSTAIPYAAETTVHVQDGVFYDGETAMCETSAIHIPGTHNLDNACAAISAVLHCDGVTHESIQQGLRDFHGLPHRLRFVREVAEVRYYDDSIATTPGSAVAALRAFSQPKVIILGGSYKGSDFSVLAQELTKHDVKALIIGDEAPRLIAAFQSVNFDRFEVVLHPTMEKIVRHAKEIAEPGSVVLLSPSAASFGLFKNYADRGDQFIAAVNDL